MDAANIMLRCHLSGLPVMDDDGTLKGIVSEGDFLRRSEIGTGQRRPAWLEFFAGPGRAAIDFAHERGRHVEDVMTRDPITVDEQAPLDELVRIMEKKGIKRLPVMSGKSLDGIVSRAPIFSRRSPASPRKSPIRPPTTSISATVSCVRSRKRIGVLRASR
jgi:CBS domain-containing protein